jgi:DNA-binding CsgD family transcriptional regulator
LAANVAALDRIGRGVVLFGPAGNIVFANRAALEVATREDGLRLRRGNAITDGFGWLAASTPEAEIRLMGEIEASLRLQPTSVEHFCRGVNIPRAAGKRPYIVQFSSLTPDNEFSRGERQALAIGFIIDPDATPQLDAQLLRQTFGLTAAEAALAQELLSGDSVKDLAARTRVSEHTVKTQLQSVYDKTNTHRQSQLMRLLMSLASTKQ